jgi:hypothetical protein
MEHVVIERVFDRPVGPGEVETLEERAAPCFQMHRVRHLRTYLSPEGQRMVCLFEAPDAESVRIANREIGIPVARAWTASVHVPGPPSTSSESAQMEEAGGARGEAEPTAGSKAASREHEMAYIVVERDFDEPVDFREIQAIEDRGAWCLKMYRVSFLRTYFSADRRRMICVYQAPDAEHVRLAQRRAGMPFERVWTASIHGTSE